MNQDIIGWDIGGAHLKIAHIVDKGLVKSVHQIPCPLWQGLDQLETAIQETEKLLDVTFLNGCQHSITMTAELVDYFENKDHGIDSILSLLQQTIEPERLWIFCGRDGFLPVAQITPEHYPMIASANWLATSMLVSKNLKEGLIIDIGSTTTDIVAIESHKISTTAISDFDRLIIDELVYTGVVRTPVMAVSDYVYFRGNKVALMAEYFATMADVYRILNELPENADQGDTADGKPKTIAASQQRLARMIGLDQHSASNKDWFLVAKILRSMQLKTITQATYRVLSTLPEIQLPLIGAGIGRFLVRDLAIGFGFQYRDFSQLGIFQYEKRNLTDTSDYAPAVAVGCLLYEQLHSNFKNKH